MIVMTNKCFKAFIILEEYDISFDISSRYRAGPGDEVLHQVYAYGR